MIFNMGHGSRGKGAETEQADRNGSSAAKHRRAFLMLRWADRIGCGFGVMCVGKCFLPDRERNGACGGQSEEVMGGRVCLSRCTIYYSAVCGPPLGEDSGRSGFCPSARYKEFVFTAYFVMPGIRKSVRFRFTQTAVGRPRSAASGRRSRA